MFFEGYTAEQLIVGLVGIAIAVSQSLFPGISILEFLKRVLNLEGMWMQVVVMGFFILLAAIAMYFTGELGEVEWTLAALLEYFGWFYAISQLAYQKLKDRN